MQIKTSCAPNSQSEDQISFTFCQKGKCCSTGKIPPQKKECKINEYQAQHIGKCAQFEFISERFQGSVTYSDQSARDGWNPEWVKLFLKNGTEFTCSLDGWIDGGGIGTPTLDFYCYPGGEFLLLSNQTKSIYLPYVRHYKLQFVYFLDRFFVFKDAFLKISALMYG